MAISPLGETVEEVSIPLQMYPPQRVAPVRCYLLQTQLVGVVQFWHLCHHTPF